MNVVSKSFIFLFIRLLMDSLCRTLGFSNNPKRQKCGAPDYILTLKDIPIGFVEAKDVGDPDLDGLKKSGNKEQFNRYKASLENLIFTDYVDFHWYKDGELVMQVAIGKIFGNKIIPIPENFDEFELLINQFCSFSGQTIKSAKKLAEMMAGKARLLA
ncbi:MAG: DNA methyltransferase, partial [Psychroflexus sp.]